MLLRRLRSFSELAHEHGEGSQGMAEFPEGLRNRLRLKKEGQMETISGEMTKSITAPSVEMKRRHDIVRQRRELQDKVPGVEHKLDAGMVSLSGRIAVLDAQLQAGSDSQEAPMAQLQAEIGNASFGSWADPPTAPPQASAHDGRPEHPGTATAVSPCTRALLRDVLLPLSSSRQRTTSRPSPGLQTR